MTSTPGHVLLLGYGPDGGSAIADILEAHGLRVVSSLDPVTGLAQAAAARLVVIDHVPAPLDRVTICSRIRATPGLADLPVLCIASTESVEERVRLLEAGADDVISRPFDALELEARVDGLLVRTQRGIGGVGGVDVATPSREVPRLVAFFGPKGGSGTTTMAVNAAVVLASREDRRIALADLDLQWGDVAIQLDVEARQPVSDLARDPDALAERGLVEGYARRHASGLWVFGAPSRPDDAEAVGPADIAELLTGLRDAFDMVLVDAGSTYDALTATTFEYADRLVVPVLPEIPALRAVRTLLQMLGESQRGAAGLVLVLNHVFARDMLRRDEIENALSERIDLELPFDAEVYLAAANAGEPVVVRSPRSPAAARLAALATILMGESPAARADGRRRFGILRRG